MGYLLRGAIGSDPFEKSKSKEKVEEVRRVPTNKTITDGGVAPPTLIH